MDETTQVNGILYIVSTPIGNLKDISFRAVEVLAEVSLIAAEDTRRTQVLLDHYQIKSATTSYYDFNKEQKTPIIINKLKSGASVALVSDAGTPGVSDPCYYLIREAIKENIPVTTIPGPVAFIPALLLSGLPLHRFVFEGFLPAKKGRHTKLTELSEEKRTIIFYESPHRIEKTLNQILEYFGNRRIALVKELTKLHETVIRGTAQEILDRIGSISLKGEWVIVVEGAKEEKKK